MYARVASEPHAGYHFEVGLGLADNLGYPAELLDRVPKEAVDSFVAARLVKANGKIVGIDITPEQLDNANRLRGDSFHNIEFRHARIDDLPFERPFGPPVSAERRNRPTTAR